MLYEQTTKELIGQAERIRYELDCERDLICNDVYEKKHRFLNRIEQELEER